MPAFFQRSVRCAAVLVAVAICGGPWAVLQSLAWTTMLVDYSRKASLSEAVVKTFDGQHPCAICKSIAQGAESERKHGVKNVTVKRDLFLHTVPLVFARPDFRWEAALPGAAPMPRSEPPPIPPPRVALS